MKMQTHTPPQTPGANCETTSGRVIFVHHAYKRMTPEQLRAALSSVDADDPRIVAIEQLIDEELGDAMLSASDPNLDHTKGTHAGGRVDALATLKNRISELRK